MRSNQTPVTRDSTTLQRRLMRPDIGKATAHLHGLAQHLWASGLYGEAVAAEHAIDMLIPERRVTR